MKPTAPRNFALSVDDICRIIETSAQSGVLELKFESLHVSFGQKAEKVESPLETPFVQQNSAPSAVEALTEEQHIEQSRDLLEKEEVMTREDQIARALIEDPLKYEELLSQGELTDAVDSSDSDEE